MTDEHNPVAGGYDYKNEEYVLSMNQLITNPAGKHTGMVAARKDIIENMNSRFSRLVNDQTKKFTTRIYSDDTRSFYVFHIKVPTEQKTTEDLRYDVIIHVTIPEGVDKPISLFNYPCMVYSNSPAFAFTYAYVLNKLGFVPPYMVTKKMTEESKKTSPEKRNPFETIGFEKSLFFAISYIKMNNYMSVNTISRFIKKFDEKAVLQNIKAFDDKLAEVQHAKQKDKKKSDMLKRSAAKSKNDQSYAESKVIKKVTVIQTGNTVKKSKTVKKIKTH